MPGSHGVTLDGIQTAALGEARLLREGGGVECPVTQRLTYRLLDWEFPVDDQLFMGRERPNDFLNYESC
ncbi:hypothetical protein CEXT_348201 [Caerostris extrusa]|uniref:Uncharacterized protein n=1 Tax=Caerostris extrusa TaxID=172846 RepID=A0AAV4P2M3_CAEEX|nr:hypothetical protein CEXT_348201 [Caerostris extrusa]